MSHLDKALIQKFLNNKCTSEEVSFIEKYLRDHPDALDQILSEEEWKQHAERFGKRKIYQLRFFRIAAMLVICFGLGLLIYQNQQKPAPSVASVIAANKLVTERNSGTADLIFQAEDGSKITLLPGAVLTYYKPMLKDKRNFILEGEAYFDVAKDKTRPFSVTAGGLTTVALGTIFKITAYSGAAETSVKLIEGKIKVTPAVEGPNKNKPYYLAAGDEIRLNRETYAINHSIFKAKEQYADLKVKEPSEEVEADRSELTASYIKFNNERLEKVLDLLNAELQANIRYNRKEIRKLYFSGEFKRETDADGASNDPLIVKEILSTVSTLNHLHLKEDQDGYYLTRKKTK